MNYGGGYGNSINDKMRRKAGMMSNAKKAPAGNGGKGGAKGGPKRLKPKKGR